EPLRVLVGHDGEMRVLDNDVGGVDQLAVHARGERRLAQSRANAARDLIHRHRVVEAELTAIGQGDNGHSGNFSRARDSCCLGRSISSRSEAASSNSRLRAFLNISASSFLISFTSTSGRRSAGTGRVPRLRPGAGASQRAPSMMSVTPLWMPRGVMPWVALY